MHNFALLLKKELWENWANGKIVIVFTISIFLSVFAPYMSYENNIERNFGSFYISQINGGVLLESFYQYLIIILIIFVPLMAMGIVANEIKNHTAASLLVKPIGRAGYILSKFTMYFLIFGVSATLAIFFSAMYANSLSQASIEFSKICLIWCLVLAFIAFAVALLLFLSTIVKNQLVVGAVGLVVLLGSGLVESIIGDLAKLLPWELFNWIREILTMNPDYVNQTLIATQHSPAWPAFFVSVISAVIFIVVSIFTIKRKEL